MAVRWLLVYNKDWWKGKYHLKIHVDVTRDRGCSTWLAEHMTHALTDRLTEIPFNVHMTCSVNGYPVFMLVEKCFYKLNAFLSWPTLRWDLWRSCSFQDFKKNTGSFCTCACTRSCITTGTVHKKTLTEQEPAYKYIHKIKTDQELTFKCIKKKPEQESTCKCIHEILTGQELRCRGIHKHITRTEQNTYVYVFHFLQCPSTVFTVVTTLSIYRCFFLFKFRSIASRMNTSKASFRTASDIFFVV